LDNRIVIRFHWFSLLAPNLVYMDRYKIKNATIIAILTYLILNKVVADNL
jgi:hypothetical protein